MFIPLQLTIESCNGANLFLCFGKRKETCVKTGCAMKCCNNESSDAVSWKSMCEFASDYNMVSHGTRDGHGTDARSFGNFFKDVVF